MNVERFNRKIRCLPYSNIDQLIHLLEIDLHRQHTKKYDQTNQVNYAESFAEVDKLPIYKQDDHCLIDLDECLSLDLKQKKLTLSTIIASAY